MKASSDMAEAAGEDLEVRGSELLLRYAREDDAPALFALASDPDVTRFFSWGPYTDESEAAAYVRSLTRKRADGERLEMVIVHPRGRRDRRHRACPSSRFGTAVPWSERGTGANGGGPAPTGSRRHSCSRSRSGAWGWSA